MVTLGWIGAALACAGFGVMLLRFRERVADIMLDWMLAPRRMRESEVNRGTLLGVLILKSFAWVALSVAILVQHVFLG